MQEGATLEGPCSLLGGTCVENEGIQQGPYTQSSSFLAAKTKQLRKVLGPETRGSGYITIKEVGLKRRAVNALLDLFHLLILMYLPKGSKVVPFWVVYLQPQRRKIGHNQKRTTLEPLGGNSEIHRSMEFSRAHRTVGRT